MTRNILLTIEYDGSCFHGWQRQPEKRTVQGELERALSNICGGEITINGTSRTDAGVHATGQCATFTHESGIPTERIPIAANDILSDPNRAGDIRIVSAREMPEDFHARFQCRGKTYRYLIRNAREMSVFLRNYRYHIKDELDLNAMIRAATFFEGTHDFASFQASGGYERKTTVRNISEMRVYEPCANEICLDSLVQEGDIVIEVTGDGFLYNMVRIIAGTLVEIGQGKKDPDDVTDIIDGKDRRLAGHTAPPQGLYLAKVFF